MTLHGMADAFRAQTEALIQASSSSKTFADRSAVALGGEPGAGAAFAIRSAEERDAIDEIGY